MPDQDPSDTTDMTPEALDIGAEFLHDLRTLISRHVKVGEKSTIEPLVGGLCMFAEITLEDGEQYIFSSSDGFVAWTEVGVLGMRIEFLKALWVGMEFGIDEDEDE